jgi:hypothetical protein
MADMTIQDVRQKFPQYSDLSDEKLAQGIHKKYYPDMPFEDFSKKIGYSASDKPPSETRKGFDAPAMAESAVTGGVMGFAAPEATALLGKGLSYVPYPPVKAAGYALQAAAPVMASSLATGRFLPAVTGFLGGGTGELGGQVAEKAGAPKPISESVRILGSMVPDALRGSVGTIADLISKKTLGVPATKVAKTMIEKLGIKEDLMNDTEKKVTLAIDQTLLSNYEYVGFHPMQNDYTTAIKKEDVKKIIDLSHHEAVVIDFTTLEGVAPAEGVPA